MKYTFGKTLAAQKIETILDNNPSARRKISTLLSNYSSHLLKITAAKDPETVRLCMELLRDYTLKRLDIKDIPDDVRSYAKNLVIARHRVFRQCFDNILLLMAKKQIRRILTSRNNLI